MCACVSIQRQNIPSPGSTTAIEDAVVARFQNLLKELRSKKAEFTNSASEWTEMAALLKAVELAAGVWKHQGLITILEEGTAIHNEAMREKRVRSITNALTLLQDYPQEMPVEKSLVGSLAEAWRTYPRVPKDRVEADAGLCANIELTLTALLDHCLDLVANGTDETAIVPLIVDVAVTLLEDLF